MPLVNSVVADVAEGYQVVGLVEIGSVRTPIDYVVWVQASNISLVQTEAVHALAVHLKTFHFSLAAQFAAFALALVSSCVCWCFWKLHPCSLMRPGDFSPGLVTLRLLIGRRYISVDVAFKERTRSEIPRHLHLQVFISLQCSDFKFLGERADTEPGYVLVYGFAEVFVYQKYCVSHMVLS